MSEPATVETRRWSSAYGRPPTEVSSFAADVGSRSSVSPGFQHRLRSYDYDEFMPGPSVIDQSVGDIWVGHEAGRVQKPSAEDKLHAQILSYVSLPHGWDGYEGKSAELEAAIDAIAFLAHRPSDIPLPYPEIGSDGAVGLYWKTEDVFAEVEFDRRGEYSYYAKYSPHLGEPIEGWRDRCDAQSDSWPEGLLRVLNRLSGEAEAA